MLNHIELAKECGDMAPYLLDDGETVDFMHQFTCHQLAAFANAIVEECAKQVDGEFKTATTSRIADAIRALKVKE